MATKKKTQKEWYEEIIAVLTDEGQKDFLRSRIEQLEKKNASTSGKMTPLQLANAELAQRVLDFMETGKPYTVSELMKSCPAFKEIAETLSNQKATSIVRSLVPEKVERSVDKGKAYFTKI